MINNSAVNSQFGSFISSQFDFDETQVVSKSLDAKNGIIRVAVVGKRLDSSTGGYSDGAFGIQPSEGHEAVSDPDGVYSRNFQGRVESLINTWRLVVGEELSTMKKNTLF